MKHSACALETRGQKTVTLTQRAEAPNTTGNAAAGGGHGQDYSATGRIAVPLGSARLAELVKRASSRTVRRKAG
jgi:hypothetical protein